MDSAHYAGKVITAIPRSGDQTLDVHAVEVRGPERDILFALGRPRSRLAGYQCTAPGACPAAGKRPFGPQGTEPPHRQDHH